MNPNSVKYARDESITKHFTVLKCSIIARRGGELSDGL